MPTFSGKGQICVSRTLSKVPASRAGWRMISETWWQWMQPVLNFLPFRGLMDTPFRMYLGHIPPAQLPLILGHQLAWTLALIALGRWILAQSVRHLVIQGG